MTDRVREGRIAGHTLKVLRESVGLTQEQFAERLGVEVTTIQGWESGRRSLLATPTSTYLALRSSLMGLGAHPRWLAQLDDALEVDRFLGFVLGASARSDVVDEHPLAARVVTRSFTDLVAWPFTRTTPTGLADAAERSGRGPATRSPALSKAERSRFIDHLKRVAEKADTARPGQALLRRQAHYLVGFDQGAETAEWLSWLHRAEERGIRRPGEWSPAWAVVRSGAHSLARNGDREGLQRFVSDYLTDQTCEVANLNYWAYWLGEVTEPQVNDLFMVNLPVEIWPGTRILKHLMSRLSSTNPYIDVVVHTLWALIMLRPTVLNRSTAVHLYTSAGQLLDEAEVSPQARRELDAVVYALRMLDRD
ncbi:helix-turn-helix domain-containing protein [Nonomuraea sp. NPDC059023]|uniref:helix-turn-helix domain-containing protein n=1 Tax=unclassified Nonomuraea TaxID=2593643 RepID=UPI0036B048AD